MIIWCEKVRLYGVQICKGNTQTLTVDRHAISTLSIETHLAVLSGLPTKKFLREYVNEKSSTERRS